ncbi:RDD family protein [Rubripirellula amarantea]|uniref:RDD family protein n=1 Tax=Rubripirellula amarantea TaxID=2527999 RepID=A0A5C5WID5_9BACT|nr:RDD family protein [Rubripirellula amarantea]TWT50498.1 RDD family protein [Rubripirellula amarantea]
MKIKCPACAKLLNIPDTAAGKVVKCPCGRQLKVPGGAPATAGAQSASRSAGAGGPARPATPNGPKPRPAAAPRAMPAGPSSFDDGFFDELTDQDLQPVKPVAQYGRAVSTATSPLGDKLVNQYASQRSIGEGLVQAFNFELASPGIRIAATLIDGAMYILFGVIGFFAAGAILVAKADPDDVSAQNAAFYIVLGFFFVPYIANMVLISLRGQSVGKLLLGIQIRNQATGAPATFFDGFLVRVFGFNVITNIPILGFFVAVADLVYLFMEGHETLHDKMARTMVVKYQA